MRYSVQCVGVCLLLVVCCCIASGAATSSSSSSSGVPKNPLIAEIEKDLDGVCEWVQEFYARRKLPKECENPPDGCRPVDKSSSTSECSKDYYTPTQDPSCPDGSARIDKNKTIMMSIEEWRSSRWEEVLCRMDGIGKQLVEVGNNATNVTHVFAGFPGGALRMWPAMDWSLNSSSSSSSGDSTTDGKICPGYDPRESSWYALASTGPLDVVVVLDVSKVMCENSRSDKAAEAVSALIRMLSTGVNFVNVVLFNETHTSFLPSLKDQTVGGEPVLKQLSAAVGEAICDDLADSKAKCDSKEETPSVVSDDNTMFVQAIEKAQEMLKYSRKVGDKTNTYSAFCRRAIVVLSASSAKFVNITPEQSSDSSEEEDVSRISVFAFSYGTDLSVQAAHKELTCNNSGLHSIMMDNVTSHVNEIFKITQYFAAGMLESNTMYTPASEHDTMMRGTLIASRSCRWLISSPPKLLAVVGVAVPMRHVQESLSQEESLELEAQISVCPAFELETYGVEELRGIDRCESAIDLFLITFSIIIGFFVVVITSVWISCTMLPAKTLQKFFPCCVTAQKNVLDV